LKIRQEVESFISAFAQKDSFSRSFSYVFAGKVIIIILTLLTTPLLTRLYSPEAYGYFSFMNTVASNVAVLATLGFPAALLITKNDREFYNLFFSIVFISLALLLVFSGFFLLFLDQIVPFKLGRHKWSYAAIIILGAAVFTFMQTFANWNIWRSQFKTGAKINVMVNGSSRITSLAIGYLFGNAFGLMIGEIFGKMLGLLTIVFVNLKKEWKEVIQQLRVADMVSITKKFKRYPYYVLPGGYIGLLSNHIPLLIFPYVFSSATFGNYSLASGLIAMPSVLLAQPLSSIFLKKMVVMHSGEKDRIPLVLKRVLNGLFLAGVLPFSFVAVFGPEIFAFVFGDEWITAGRFSSILALYALIEMLQVSVQNVLQVFSMENVLFRFKLIQFSLIVFFILPGIFVKDPILMIWGFSVARMCSALFVLRTTMVICGFNSTVLLIRFLFIFILFLGFFSVLKMGLLIM
jgi:O-antigen/teichoic acid export membrane protein